jgi:solute carrier family 35 protein F5
VFAISLIPKLVKYLGRHGVRGAKSDAALLWRQFRNNNATPGTTPGEEEGLMAGERLLPGGELDTRFHARADGKLGFHETAVLSLEFCLLWFVANYLSSACLEYTSVASTTILTSTSGIWTLILGAIFGVERFSVRKLIGVAASLVGVVLISTVDLTGDNDENRGSFPHKTPAQIALGDSMALVSALVYGMYVTIMKRRVGNEEKVDMKLFFGLVGVLNLVLLWPIFFILHWTGIEPFQLPPTGTIWTIVIVNSLSSFVSDLSWALAMLLTTPLVVTVGLSLTIPLSLIGEVFQYGQYSSFLYWIGAAVVVLSFVFINHESHDEDEERNDDGATIPIVTA